MQFGQSPFDGHLLQLLPWTNGIAGTMCACRLWWELWVGSVSSSGILCNGVRTGQSAFLDHTVRLPIGRLNQYLHPQFIEG